LDSFALLQRTDERFFKSKLIQMISPFDFILVSETGYLALKSHKMQEPKIIHIKDITGFEIVPKRKYPEDLKVIPYGLFGELRLLIAFMDKSVSLIKTIIYSSLFSTVIRGLWFQFKTNDSLDPVIEITAIDMPYNRRRTNAEYYQKELLEKINNLGIGPLGMGGRITALDVFIEYFPCHITALPVAVNLQCHSSRFATEEM